MTSSPILYDDGCDRFVWCVDERGVVRVWPLAGFPETGAGVALARWGWRYATEAEVRDQRVNAAGTSSTPIPNDSVSRPSLRTSGENSALASALPASSTAVIAQSSSGSK